MHSVAVGATSGSALHLQVRWRTADSAGDRVQDYCKQGVMQVIW